LVQNVAAGGGSEAAGGGGEADVGATVGAEVDAEVGAGIGVEHSQIPSEVLVITVAQSIPYMALLVQLSAPPPSSHAALQWRPIELQ